MFTSMLGRNTNVRITNTNKESTLEAEKRAELQADFQGVGLGRGEEERDWRFSGVWCDLGVLSFCLFIFAYVFIWFWLCWWCCCLEGRSDWTGCCVGDPAGSRTATEDGGDSGVGRRPEVWQSGVDVTGRMEVDL